MYSLFEEQIIHESLELDHFLSRSTDSSAEALSAICPIRGDYSLLPEKYLEHVRQAQEGASSIPVIGSLNGVSKGGWIRYARLIQDAGADALELNLYYHADRSGPDRPRRSKHAQVELVAAVKPAITIPLAVKLSPFYTSLPNFVAAAGRGRRRRDGALQPLLPARFRPRRAGHRAHAWI